MFHTVGHGEPPRSPATAPAPCRDTGNTHSDAAPPTYILRLDGVIGGGIATFSGQGVTLEILADGSARLFETLAVGRPAAPDPAFGTLWDLDTT